MKGKEIILNFCKTHKTNNLEFLECCKEVELELSKPVLRDYITDYCPHHYGLNDYNGICFAEGYNDNKKYSEQVKDCLRCWNIALEKDFENNVNIEVDKCLAVGNLKRASNVAEQTLKDIKK